MPAPFICTPHSRGSFLQARHAARSAGRRLPLLPELENFLSSAPTPEIFWTGSVLAYPAIGQTFARGRDIIDRLPDNGGRLWRLPAAFLSETAQAENSIGILITEFSIETGPHFMTIHPTESAMVGPLPVRGIHDTVSSVLEGFSNVPFGGIPQAFQDSEHPHFCRIERSRFAGVRPLALSGNSRDRDIVFAGHSQDTILHYTFTDR